MENLEEMKERKLLEDFLFKNPEFEKLKSIINEFNIFKILNIVDAEIKHSNFLAWLLNPDENHGFGSYFLKKFISTFLYSNPKDNISLIEFEDINFDKVEVKREWMKIDILVDIVENNNKYLLVIENKIWSAENDNQLNKYYNLIEDKYKEHKKFYIYLLPDNNPYGDKSNKNWNDFHYSDLADILIQTKDYYKDITNGFIIELIDNYIKLIKREILMDDDEIKKLCSIIWKNNKDALKLLIKYEPDIINELFFKKLIENLKVDNDTIKFYGNSTMNFTTKTIINKINELNNGIELFYYIYKSTNDLYIYLYLNNGDLEKALSLYTNLGKNNIELIDRKNSIEKGNKLIVLKTLKLVNINKGNENDIDIKSMEKEFESNFIKFNNFIKEIDNVINKITL